MGSAASKPASTTTPVSVNYDEKRSISASSASNMAPVTTSRATRNYADESVGETEMGLTRSKLDSWQQDFDAVSPCPSHPGRVLLLNDH